jgi:hypothetical protein
MNPRETNTDLVSAYPQVSLSSWDEVTGVGQLEIANALVYEGARF